MLLDPAGGAITSTLVQGGVLGDEVAVSPDGSTIAFAVEPMLRQGCVPSQPNLAGDYKLVIRSLASGTEKILPLPPQVRRGGLFSPISHLSWSAGNTTLAVSVSAVQDNEGWGLNLVDTASARYYAPPGTGVRFVPVTGSPDARRSYIREGVFLPDGNLFISRACCGGASQGRYRPDRRRLGLGSRASRSHNQAGGPFARADGPWSACPIHVSVGR